MDVRIATVFLACLVNSCWTLPVQVLKNPNKLDVMQSIEPESANVFSIITKENEGSSQLLREGDIVINPGRSAIKCNDRSCFWPKSSSGTVNVPFILSGYGPDDVDKFTDAMKELASVTCIRFVGRTTETDYINISPGNGCWSSMGRTGGLQAVSLGTGCMLKGIIQHELIHALGFTHEQSRSDRDDYVRIATEYIPKDKMSNFNKEDTNNLGLEYDYSSVMHYDKYAFTSSTGQQTIYPTKDPNAEIGQRRGVSNLDVAKINKLYDCGVCRTIFNRGFGDLYSANYPSQYPNNNDCSYVMRTLGYQIVLTFKSFDLESPPNCESDYITVYDGMTTDDPILLKKACGRGSMPTVVSSGNAMMLQFVSNGAVTSSGFSANYKNVYCGQAFTNSSGTITSNNYPNNYPPKQQCGYYIWAPAGSKIQLKFNDFSLEPDSTWCQIDYLSIYDGPTEKDRMIGRYCGTKPPATLVSTGNAMFLWFYSDDSIQMKGFQATYTYVKA
uniref:Metalloendopeptidase n=1 Tax=Hynobius tokyoensis TaxID=324344 RepID=A0A140KFV3_HYNTO|nr:hatching enzyme [Hynobius tokyoensis]